MKHLLSIEDLSRSELDELLDLAASFLSVTQRETPKVPALRGRTVVSLFFEDSTRTRLSFETAAKRLSADVMVFSVATSSVKKGEGLRDTVATISAMGIDAVVVRQMSRSAARFANKEPESRSLSPVLGTLLLTRRPMTVAEVVAALAAAATLGAR